MEKQISKKENILATVLCFTSVYAFLLFLNAIFPAQSDDFEFLKLAGIQRAIQWYMTWNGRCGELLRVTFGSYLSHTPFYAPINAFVGAGVMLLVFVNIFGRLPQKSMKDVSCYAIIFAFVMFDPVFCFGSVFFWAAGSFNYLWAWFFILLVVTPLGLFWRKIKFSKKQGMAVLLLGIPVGIIAGWSSEFGIVIIVLWIASIVYAKITKIKLPAWYYTSLVAFIVGWCILYACPGTRIRVQQSLLAYLSITDLIKLGPVGLLKQIIYTFDVFNKMFYYESFCFLSLFLLLTCLFYKPSLKKFESTVLAVFLMLYLLHSVSKLFFVLCALFICIMSAIVIRKENAFLSNLFIALAGIFVSAFLFIGATIQIWYYVPKRTCFQYTLLNIGIIAINMVFCFERFKNSPRVTKIATACCISLTLLLALFVGTECLTMNKKWSAMENSIAEQKAKGIKDVVVDGDTFRSRYWSYGDWGNPGADPSVWPNTSYARYYGVETFAVK